MTAWVPERGESEDDALEAPASCTTSREAAEWRARRSYQADPGDAEFAITVHVRGPFGIVRFACYAKPSITWTTKMLHDTKETP